MAQFPELGLWRDFLERLKVQVWEGKAVWRWPARPKRKEHVEKPPDVVKEGEKADPVCWNFVTKMFCKAGERCKYLHAFPPGYDANRAAEALSSPRPGPSEAMPRQREPNTSKWASWWREAIRAVLPVNTEAAASVADLDVRKLSVALWRDIVKWAEQNDAVSHLRLFRDSTSCESAGEQDIQWAFVPASDILLTLGEGIVGITREGLMARGPSGYVRESFSAVLSRLGAFEGEDAVLDPASAHSQNSRDLDMEEQEAKMKSWVEKALSDDRSGDGDGGPDHRRSRSRSRRGSRSALDQGKEGEDTMDYVSKSKAYRARVESELALDDNTRKSRAYRARVMLQGAVESAPAQSRDWYMEEQEGEDTMHHGASWSKEDWEKEEREANLKAWIAQAFSR